MAGSNSTYCSPGVAELIQKQPAAIQLRYLQTLVEIGSEKNTTIIFPLLVDIFTSLAQFLDKGANIAD